MVNKIINEIPKIEYDITIIDLFMNFVDDQMFKEKWQFTLRTYHNLIDNIKIYEEQNSTQTIINYIVNDEATLSQMIMEFKEDIYPLFDASAFLLTKNYSLSKLKAFSKKIDSILSMYHKQAYIDQIYLTDIFKIKQFAKLVLSKIDSNNPYYLQIEKIHSVLILNKSIYIQIHQLLSKVVKHINDENIETEYDYFSMNALFLLAGDK